MENPSESISKQEVAESTLNQASPYAKPELDESVQVLSYCGSDISLTG